MAMFSISKEGSVGQDTVLDTCLDMGKCDCLWNDEGLMEVAGGVAHEDYSPLLTFS